eukprot:65609_1
MGSGLSKSTAAIIVIYIVHPLWTQTHSPILTSLSSSAFSTNSQFDGKDDKYCYVKDVVYQDIKWDEDLCWCSRTKTCDDSPWMEANLGKIYQVTDIGVSPCEWKKSEWVQTYKVRYKLRSSSSWQWYNNGASLTGNNRCNSESDCTEKKTALANGGFSAQFVRIYPLTASSSCSTNVEIYGHNTFAPTPKPTTKPTPKLTPKPTSKPTPKPTPKPTSKPTPTPTHKHTSKHTSNPTNNPTKAPSNAPILPPTPGPTQFPTAVSSLKEGGRVTDSAGDTSSNIGLLASTLMDSGWFWIAVIVFGSCLICLLLCFAFILMNAVKRAINQADARRETGEVVRSNLRERNDRNAIGAEGNDGTGLQHIMAMMAYNSNNVQGYGMQQPQSMIDLQPLPPQPLPRCITRDLHEVAGIVPEYSSDSDNDTSFYGGHFEDVGRTFGKCGDCGEMKVGKEDDSDDQFYCNDCWANYY